VFRDTRFGTSTIQNFLLVVPKVSLALGILFIYLCYKLHPILKPIVDYVETRADAKAV